MSLWDDFRLGFAGAVDAANERVESSAIGRAAGALFLPLQASRLYVAIADEDKDGRVSDDEFARQERDAALERGAMKLEADALADQANKGADRAVDQGDLGRAWRNTQRRVTKPIFDFGAGAFTVLAWGVAAIAAVLVLWVLWRIASFAYRLVRP